MSFFFIKHKRELAKAPKTPKTPIAKQQAPTLWRLGCKACPLDGCEAHTPKMAPTYGSGPLMFLAEAPGCITGDSLIDTAFRDKSIDPEGVPIKSLVGKSGFHVYCYDLEHEQITIGKVKKVWQTGRKRVFKVTYEWFGTTRKNRLPSRRVATIKVTANHQFLLRNPFLYRDPYKGLASTKRYLSIAEGLSVGHSIQPFSRTENGGYSFVGSVGRLFREAPLLLKHKLGRGIKAGKQCHHINENKLDDNLSNLQEVTITGHARHHTNKSNPMSNPLHRQAHQAVMQSGAYRKSQSKKMREVWAAKNHKIIAIEELEHDDVYDMEVEGYHNFAVNGIFVHNSDEDENTGRPLTGPSGRLLRECIDLGGGDSHATTYDNVVNCRPKGNRTPIWQEIECCRPRRIKAIERVQPKLIVGLGAIPLTFMLGTADLAGLRGRLFAVKIGNHACWFMPTYHPAYILRKARNPAYPLNSMYGHCLRMDIARACEAVRHLNPPQIHGEADVRANIQVFRGNDQYDLLLELLGVAKSAKVKAIDLETRGLRPYSAGAGIMSAAVSFNDKFNFGFAIDHPQALWTPEQKLTILSRFADLIRDDTTKVAHNAPFELEWLAWRYGTEIINHTAWECTMMQAHFLDERKGQQWDETVRASKYQSLDFLVKQHFGLSFKQLFNTNKKDMSKTDLTELLTYNAADTKYTLRLYHLQKQALGTNGDRAAYKLAVLQQPTVALMQHIGVPVHQRAIKVAQQKLGEDIEAIEYNIQDLGVVKEFAADHKGGFNPASTRDVAEIFDEYLHCPQVRVTSEHARVYNFDGQSTPKHNAHKSMKEDTVGKVRISVDKHVLEKIDHPLAKLMLRWRNKTKLKSTYVDGLPIYPDGNLHTNFNTTGTETGRLSSDEPNLQNFPKRNDAWVRSAIIPPRGSVMVAIDYGQLEACTGAMCSNDLYLCKALWDDYDIHMDWAKLIDKTKPELRNGLEMKKFRSLIKNKFVFPAFYGASAKSIAMYLKDAFGCDVDEAMVEGIMDKFWGVLSGMKRWQDNLVKQYYETGYVTTLGGRKHRYPLNVNQVINHPFQGTAAELVSDAMVRLSYLAAQTGQWFLHPILNIHDDLSFFVPEKGLYKALETIMKEMLIFDFPWVNVPLSLEVSVGPNWYDLKPLGKYWSHREFGYPAPTRKF